MLWQVARVGILYKEWVHTPVNRKLRVFKSDYMEVLSKSPWWVIPLVWIPFAIVMSMWALTGAPSFLPWIATSPPMSLLLLIALLPVGVLFWTLIEYSLHRFIFHLDPPPKSPAWITFHFLMHGLHHKVPGCYLHVVALCVGG